MGLWLPGAIRDDDHPIRRLTYTDTGEPKGCLHTTETAGKPSYSSWTIPPHGTIVPKPGVGVTVYQHIPLEFASFALRNLAGGVQTNRDRVLQWELVGTCDPGRKSTSYRWYEADDNVLRDLYRKVIAPCRDLFGIPIVAPPFQAYPASYGPSSGSNVVRMTGSFFDAYSGWLGHQHVPENTHGDPGAFPWSRMIALSGAPSGPGTTPKRTIRRVLKYRGRALPMMKGTDVGWVQILVGASRDNRFGPVTRDRVRRWQGKHGLVADGIFGPKSTKAAGWTWAG